MEQGARTRPAAVEALAGTSASAAAPNGVRRSVATFRQRLREPRFWVVQALVVLVTISHSVVEALHPAVDLGALYFAPTAMYLVPVVYASLYFGREGAIPTAIWSGLLAVPNVVIFHEGLERVGEMVQILVIVAIGSLVAVRVDREAAARRRAESEEAARRVSQAKYHALFESAGEAILVLEPGGVVEEANVAAGLLFGRPASSLPGMELAELLGLEQARSLMRFARGEEVGVGELVVSSSDGLTVWVEPVCSAFGEREGERVIQARLRDVTKRRERERDLESYAGRMLRAQEDERLRIAHEIHDGPLQSLVSLCRQLDTIGEGEGTAADPDLKVAVDSTRGIAEGIVDELRSFARGLRPSILDDLGLVAAVRGLVEEQSARTGLAGHLAVKGKVQRTHPDIELALFRIAQEALRNVERHARASNVRVRLSFGDERVALSVTDDGKGFAPQTSVAGSDRFGLLGMNERAVSVGGSFRVTSAPGGGARIEASIPVRRGVPEDHQIQPTEG